MVVFLCLFLLLCFLLPYHMVGCSEFLQQKWRKSMFVWARIKMEGKSQKNPRKSHTKKNSNANDEWCDENWKIFLFLAHPAGPTTSASVLQGRNSWWCTAAERAMHFQAHGDTRNGTVGKMNGLWSRIGRGRPGMENCICDTQNVKRESLFVLVPFKHTHTHSLVNGLVAAVIRDGRDFTDLTEASDGSLSQLQPLLPPC